MKYYTRFLKSFLIMVLSCLTLGYSFAQQCPKTTTETLDLTSGGTFNLSNLKDGDVLCIHTNEDTTKTYDLVFDGKVSVNAVTIHFSELSKVKFSGLDLGSGLDENTVLEIEGDAETDILMTGELVDIIVSGQNAKFVLGEFSQQPEGVNLLIENGAEVTFNKMINIGSFFNQELRISDSKVNFLDGLYIGNSSFSSSFESSFYNSEINVNGELAFLGSSSLINLINTDFNVTGGVYFEDLNYFGISSASSFIVEGALDFGTQSFGTLFNYTDNHPANTCAIVTVKEIFENVPVASSSEIKLCAWGVDPINPGLGEVTTDCPVCPSYEELDCKKYEGILTLEDTTTICAQEGELFAGTIATAKSYQWYEMFDFDDEFSKANDGTSDTLKIVNLGYDVLSYLEVTTAEGCVINSDTTEVLFRSQPRIDPASSFFEPCHNGGDVFVELSTSDSVNLYYTFEGINFNQSLEGSFVNLIVSPTLDNSILRLDSAKGKFCDAVISQNEFAFVQTPEARQKTSSSLSCDSVIDLTESYDVTGTFDDVTYYDIQFREILIPENHNINSSANRVIAYYSYQSCSTPIEAEFFYSPVNYTLFIDSLSMCGKDTLQLENVFENDPMNLGVKWSSSVFIFNNDGIDNPAIVSGFGEDNVKIRVENLEGCIKEDSVYINYGEQFDLSDTSLYDCGDGVVLDSAMIDYNSDYNLTVFVQISGGTLELGIGDVLDGLDFHGTHNAVVTSKSTVCTDNFDLTINDREIEITDSSTSISCFGESNGDASITIKSRATYDVLWSNGAIEENVDNLSKGNYTVIVSNNFCGDTATVTIDESVPFQLAIDSTILCSNDQIDFVKFSDYPFYSISAVTSSIFSTTRNDSIIITNATNAAGFIAVTGIDRNSCINEDSVYVEYFVPNAKRTIEYYDCGVGIELIEDSLTGFPNSVVLDIKDGNTGGSIALNSIVLGLDYPSNNVVTFEDTITGCISENTFVVYEASFTNTVITKGPTCRDGNDGSAKAEAFINGINFSNNNFQYSWSVPAIVGLPSDSIINLLPDSTYKSYVTHSITGCTDSTEFILSNPDSVYMIASRIIEITDTSDQSALEFAITLNSTVGASFSWTSDVFRFQDTTVPGPRIIDGIGTGFGAFTLTTDNGCVFFDTLTITVVGGPEAFNDSVEVDEDNSISIAALLNDDDVSGSGLIIAFVTAPVNGTASIIGANNDSILYTPDLNFFGTDSIGYQIQDGNGNSAMAYVIVIVNPVNDVPEISSSPIITANEDETATLDISSYLSDQDGDQIGVTIISASNGTATGTSPDNISYVPDPNFFGSDTLIFTFTDGFSSPIQDTIFVTVNNVNDVPVANDTTITINLNTVTVINPTLNDIDIDGDVLNLTSGTATYGSVSINANQFEYTPLTDFVGVDTIVYTIDDQNGGVVRGLLIITIIGGPEAFDDLVEVDEDNSISIAVLLNDDDVSGTGLAMSIITNPMNGTVSITGANNDSILYTPNLNFFGTDSIGYQIEDRVGNIATAYAIVIVNPINDVPEISSSPIVIVKEDEITILDISSYLSDQDGDVIGVDNISPFKGIAFGTSPDNISYISNANFFGIDTLIFTFTDGFSSPIQDTIFVTVENVNDEPEVIDTAVTISINTVTAINPTLNDTDIDGDILSLTSGTATYGSVSVNVIGEFDYTPLTDFIGVDTIVYTIDDQNGGIATGLLIVTIVDDRRSAEIVFTHDSICQGEVIDVSFGAFGFSPDASITWEIAGDMSIDSIISQRFGDEGLTEIKLTVTDVDTVVEVTKELFVQKAITSNDYDYKMTVDRGIEEEVFQLSDTNTVFTCSTVALEFISNSNNLVSDLNSDTLKTEGWTTFTLKDEFELCSIDDSINVVFNSVVEDSVSFKINTINGTHDVTINFDDFLEIASAEVISGQEYDINVTDSNYTVIYTNDNSGSFSEVIEVTLTDVCGNTKEITHEVELIIEELGIDTITLMESQDTLFTTDSILQQLGTNLRREIEFLNQLEYQDKLVVSVEGESIQVVVLDKLPEDVEDGEIVRVRYEVCEFDDDSVLVICYEPRELRIRLVKSTPIPPVEIDDGRLDDANAREEFEVILINSAVSNNVGLSFGFEWGGEPIDPDLLTYELTIVSRWNDIVYQEEGSGEEPNWHGENRPIGLSSSDILTEKVSEGNYFWLLSIEFINKNGSIKHINERGFLYYIPMETAGVSDDD